MKKWTALILFGVLLTSAGCGNAPADSAVQETKATTETTEEVVYTDPVTYAVYETLDALTADFPKKQPGATQYQPPQAVLDSWEFRQGIIDNTYYNYTFYDAEQGRTIFLEIGTPFCITVDFETVESDNCVTIRDRDTMEQVRMPIDELVGYLEKKIEL